MLFFGHHCSFFQTFVALPALINLYTSIIFILSKFIFHRKLWNAWFRPQPQYLHVINTLIITKSSDLRDCFLILLPCNISTSPGVVPTNQNPVPCHVDHPMSQNSFVLMHLEKLPASNGPETWLSHIRFPLTSWFSTRPYFSAALFGSTEIFSLTLHWRSITKDWIAPYHQVCEGWNWNNYYFIVPNTNVLRVPLNLSASGFYVVCFMTGPVWVPTT